MANRRWAAALAAATMISGSLSVGRDANAFCGFYVSGADARLTNGATQVVLLREGTRTVLSMQNAYQGPPQDFALVVPVPVVLKKENVKTLPREIFDRVDQLTAPRLVEYWEQDPCPRPEPVEEVAMKSARRAAPAMAALGLAAPSPPPVKIEAQFSVGEYDVVVLSATDSVALDSWLRQNRYKIPAGAEPYLRPYVELGMKFFVAKVDVSKVKFERLGNGPEQAILSPLRFHYDADGFSLPIRLGLINSGGTQDLVVTILARGQRYEVANYDNVAIATNIDVTDATRDHFASFYSTLFDDTTRRHPRAVVTEYSWAAQSCDPCPTPPLQPSDLMTLGEDALPSTPAVPASVGPRPGPVFRRSFLPMAGGGFVITRLHARYTKDALGDDLVFRPAPPIVGGREFMQNDGKLEQGARPDSINNFQARYAIRHAWTGPIACSEPQRGIWGGRPGGGAGSGASAPVRPAARLGFLPRSGPMLLSAFVAGSVPPESVLSIGAAGSLSTAMPLATGVDASPASDDAGADGSAAPSPPGHPTIAVPPRGGCAGCSASDTGAWPAGACASLPVIVAGCRRRRGR